MNDFEKQYAKLNPRQREAVDAIEGPLMVIAGPGSGKTEILSMRVANILRNMDLFASNILCLTFTESAAYNMRKRLRGLIGNEAYRVAIHTFHSFGAEVINRHPEFFYQGASFYPADELTQIEVLEEIFSELPHENPLSAKHPEQGYTYLRDARDAIAALKKAGVTEEEFDKILDHNSASCDYIRDRVTEVFGGRLSAKQLDKTDRLVLQMRAHKGADFPVRHMKPLLRVVALSLEVALEEAKEAGKTSPLSFWKQKWTAPSGNGARILKSEAYLERMRALEGIYKEYRERMHSRGYYDFEDMLLDVIEVAEKNDVLRAELQEQYQYILVDEFQDTNDAQMRLLRLLGESEVNERKPNIMAVGDDDQAIFKFQGAEVSNMLHFIEAYRDVKVVTLVDNYRSTGDILGVAERVIRQGRERLVNIIPTIEKKLVAAGEHLEKGKIVSRSFPTQAHEYHYIAKEIERLTREGTRPGGIAAIARFHKNLEGLAAFLQKAGIAVQYERQRDVLKEPHIRQLIAMCRLCESALRKKFDEVDYLLPEILSYPFWNLSRSAIWELALVSTTSGHRQSWINSMLRGSDARMKSIAEFFIDVSRRAQYEPLEYVLDALITGPFKEYYFGRDRFEGNKAQYLSFLSSLRAFINALREYKRGEPLGISDLVVFVDTHEKSKIPLMDLSAHVDARDSVHLLSAHKAKGLEFDTVFILDCQDEVWAGRGRANKLPFPPNLALTPASENTDDQLRLFYVALTRAKRNLYLTWYKFSDTGRESRQLQFIAAFPGEDAEEAEEGSREDSISNDIEMYSYAWQGFNRPPFEGDERALLEELVRDYRMSVTHLNNFLDVARGGPQFFLEQNLLRFPQPKSVAGVYGSAMHKTMQMIYLEVKKNGVQPSLERVRSWFEEFLSAARLNARDYEQYLKRGQDSLNVFYKERRDTFEPGHEVEVDFKEQGVLVGDAHLAGKIDKIVRVSPSQMSVHDFKTGKALGAWTMGVVKALGYKRQLLFYKLLVENSRAFGGTYTVERGVLEFLEPRGGRIVDLPLDIKAEDIARLRKLIHIVYAKIKNFEFPDIRSYPKNAKGSIAFENDLLAGKV